MDDRQLRTFQRAAQPILQRTAPVESQARTALTPAVLDQVAWNVVLAYVVNVAEQRPCDVPRGARTGEGALPSGEVRAALGRLHAPSTRPRRDALNRFRAAAGRLLEAYGWAPQQAALAAGELARALSSL